MTVPIL